MKRNDLGPKRVLESVATAMPPQAARAVKVSNLLSATIKLMIMIAIVTALLLWTSATAQQVGDKAPPFTLVNGSGKLLSLDDYLGRPLILNAWASWCAPCVEELPFFEQIYNEVNKNGEAQNLDILLINNNEDPEQALRFLRDELGIRLETALEPSRAQRDSFETLDSTLEVIRRYRIRGMPSSFFIDEAGVVRAVKVGFLVPAEAPALLETIGIDWQP